MIISAFIGLTLGAETAAERDAQPLGRYLTLEDIHQVIEAAQPSFAECYAHSGARGRVEVGEVFMEFTIAPSGQVSDATVRDSRSGVPDLDACLRERTLALSFRAHDEAPMLVGYPFVFREGTLLTFPMVFVKERAATLPFFYLPGQPVEADRWLRALSGRPIAGGG